MQSKGKGAKSAAEAGKAKAKVSSTKAKSSRAARKVQEAATGPARRARPRLHEKAQFLDEGHRSRTGLSIPQPVGVFRKEIEVLHSPANRAGPYQSQNL